MADLTWIDVADTAVKILGGASFAGAFAYFVDKSRQTHELRKAKYENELEILKDIVENVEQAAAHINDYSHLSRSVTLPSEAFHAKENSKIVMTGFKSMLRAKGLAYLINLSELSTLLESSADSILELYYIASEDIPKADIDNVQATLSTSSEKLKLINECMETLRQEISVTYSKISAG